jgi:hypothetical protein
LAEPLERFVDLGALLQTGRAGALGKLANFHIAIFLSYIAARDRLSPSSHRFQLSNAGSSKKFPDVNERPRWSTGAKRFGTRRVQAARAMLVQYGWKVEKTK